MTNLNLCDDKLKDVNKNHQKADELIEKINNDDIESIEAINLFSDILSRQNTLLNEIQTLKCTSLIQNDVKNSKKLLSYVQKTIQNTPVSVNETLSAILLASLKKNENITSYLKYNIKNGFTHNNRFFSDLHSSPNKNNLFKKVKKEIEEDIFNTMYLDIGKNEPLFAYELMAYRQNIDNILENQKALAINKLNLVSFQDLINLNKLQTEVKNQYKSKSIARICNYMNTPNKVVKNRNEEHNWNKYRKQIIDLLNNKCHLNYNNINNSIGNPNVKINDWTDGFTHNERHNFSETINDINYYIEYKNKGAKYL